jgi:ribosome recycling factor
LRIKVLNALKFPFKMMEATFVKNGLRICTVPTSLQLSAQNSKYYCSVLNYRFYGVMNTSFNRTNHHIHSTNKTFTSINRCSNPHDNNNINNNNHRQKLQQPIGYRMMSNHGAKKGLHLQHLTEMAHQKEHDAAVARREKKKEKNSARKGGKQKGSSTASTQQEILDEFDEYEKKDTNKNLHSNTLADTWDKPEEDEEEHDITVLPNPKDVKVKMMKHVDTFKDYLKSIRGGGQPSVEMFDDMTVVDAYGHGTGDVSVKALAQIVITSPTQATATCFDPTTCKAVVKAIRDTLELNPQQEEGTGVIKIPIPRISMDVRQQMVSNLQKRAENFRVRIRNHRRTVLDIVKQGVAGKLDGVSKDDAFRVQQDIETMTDVVIKELNKLLEKKESDIMSV